MDQENQVIEKFSYDNAIVKNFAIATMLWGAVGMLVGVIVAMQLTDASYNMGNQYTTFGRLRPLHTNAVIFAFVGNGIFMGVYYSLQRLCKTRMFSDLLSKVHFWGWQLIIVTAALTLPLGLTTGKEYAELEWWVDIMVALVWVVFGINMFGTIIKRREKHLYVAIWFFIGTWITVTVLHVVNSLALPVSLTKSYTLFAGVQDALVQWWYGHNAVAFFLTTPYLGLMYYFVPKAANRPVYSYRLSIIHFWALIFIYIWAGPHHLLYTSLPDWAQSLGVVFSVMLIAPSWGGMINGLLTLRGAWDKVAKSPTLKFMVVAVTAYGMATFEGPMMSFKNVNSLAHFSDWIVGHAHLGALGWNGFLTFGVLYFLIPKMFNTKLHSTKLANVHFWIGTLGILLYCVPLYWGGIVQSLMWREFDAEGKLLYGDFLTTVTEIIPMYRMRAIGGTVYLIGAIIMVWNLVATMMKGSFIANEEAEAPALIKAPAKKHKGEHWHRYIESRPMKMLVFSLVLVLIGGLVELVPTFLVDSNIPTIANVKPYTPLELEGRDIYVREGCYTCHSQMIRPFRFETERYGEYSKAGEFVYDHPFQWGSKRTGPDLAREGVGLLKKSDSWHYIHLIDPRNTSPESIMPAYDWLAEQDVELSTIKSKIQAMQTLGVPYEEGYEDQAEQDYMKQAEKIAKGLNEKQLGTDAKKEIIALIAYLQRLGTDITVEK